MKIPSDSCAELRLSAMKLELEVELEMVLKPDSRADED